MREIIFRGIRLDTKEFTYGYLWAKNNCSVGTRTLIMNSMGSAYEVDPETVGQFSGLRDNKRTAEFPEGQEIFEGDLINFDGGIARVEWCNDLACYLAVFADVSDVMLHAISHRCAVIGNIHEHKNLLGGEVD